MTQSQSVFLLPRFPNQSDPHNPNSPNDIYNMDVLTSTIQYWLLNHPHIITFTWVQGQTHGSTPLFLATTVALYLATTVALYLAITFAYLPSLGPRILKPITAVHSFTLFLISLIMAVGCTLSIVVPNKPAAQRFHHAICFPPGTQPTGPLFFWAYIFYLSKILEFGDTVLIVLGKSIKRLSFLHVYHHATVVIMCYLWLDTRQSLFPVALVTNSGVHVIMYGYYFLCAMGVRPRWKRLVTDIQIVQFVFSFLLSGLMLYKHLVGSGCSGFSGWCFNAMFNASLLALFLDFHSKNYAKKRQLMADKHKST